jgi:hypothetical protein
MGQERNLKCEKSLFRNLGMKRPFSGTRNTHGRVNGY